MTFDEFAENICDDDSAYRRLIEMRGGCRCCISPPCHACVDPLTEREAECLGWEPPTPEEAA